MTEKQKEKYANFLDKVSEILGLNKPIDILRLCAVTDEYLKPIEKRIAEFEKENAELKEQASYLADNLRVARKDREQLQLDVGKGLQEFIKDCPATSLRYLANEKYVEQLTKAKEIIEKLLNAFASNDFFDEEELNAMAEAEQFLKETVDMSCNTNCRRKKNEGGTQKCVIVTKK